MCSISINESVRDQLNDLDRSNDRDMIEKRLYNFAKEANPDNPGALDASNTLMRRLPQELREVRKKRIGRHRIYYEGHHKLCAYQTIHIKIHKKDGVDDEDDRQFQNLLIARLANKQVEDITEPNHFNKLAPST
ncbi:MAG: hypothetical protein V1882_02045 [Candidatus Omnitrophota bacterium]